MSDTKPYAADLTVDEVAQLLHVHRNTILNLVKRGLLVAYKIGTGPKAGYRFTRPVIAEFRRRGRERPTW
jgi:excisionase family DNA binding protein